MPPRKNTKKKIVYEVDEDINILTDDAEMHKAIALSLGEEVPNDITCHPCDREEYDDIKSLEPQEPPGYVVELAKSGRAECQKCNSMIPKDELRVGIITDGQWGLYQKWQHLACTIFHRTITYSALLDGYAELDKAAKKQLEKRVEESKHEVDTDYIPVQPDDLVRIEWTQAIDPPSDLLMPLLPYQKEGLGWMAHQEESSMAGGILAGKYDSIFFSISFFLFFFLTISFIFVPKMKWAWERLYRPYLSFFTIDNQKEKLLRH